MIELKCTEASDFEFDMQLNGGAVGAVPQVIFCMDVSPTFGLTFPCVKGERGLHAVKLPSFCTLNVMPGEYPCRIMVLLGDSVFFPYVDTVLLKDDPKPVISTFARANVQAGPTVTVQPATVQPHVTAVASAEYATEAKVIEEKPIEAQALTPDAVKPVPIKAGPAQKDVEFFSSLLRRKS